MTNEIIQGDSGVVLEFTITDNQSIVNLTGSTVEIILKYKAITIKKQATITDAINGKCEVILDAEDISNVGVYSFQATCTFSDNRVFSSQIQRFPVGRKIGYIPNIGGGSSTIGNSTTNGNIVVNGIEIKVYDDTPLKTEVNDLKTTKHSHTNKSELDRLGVNENSKLTIDGVELVTGGVGSGEGSTVADSSTNGNILVNGSEIKVYDDTQIRQDINAKADINHEHTEYALESDLHSHSNKTILDQITAAFTSELKARLEALNGILVYPTVTDLQNAFPNGTDQPVWITADKSWYYWDDGVVQQPPTDTIAPNNVTNLTTSNLTTTSLTLSWTASSSSDVSGYDIYNGSTLLTTIVGTTYNVTGLIEKTSYTFTVKAKDTANNIASGTSVNVTTVDATAPNNVTNLTTSNVTATSLTLSWTASTSNDVTGYEVYNGSTLLTTVTGVTYNVSGLTANTNYTFTVKAKDGANNVASGNSVSVTTSAIADTTAPNDVTNLTTSNLSTTSVTLNWTASSSSDVVGYDIFNGVSLITSTASTSYTVTGLTHSTQYTLTVKSKDGAGNTSSGTSVTFTTVTPDTTAPDNVTNLTTSNVTQTSLTLNWAASVSSDVASYDVYNGATLLGNVTGTTYNVSGLTASTQYTFHIRAKDGSNNISSGTSVTITTSAPADTTAPVVTANPVAGTYTSTQSVTLSTNETATIYYTTDGSTPTTSSLVYSSPISISVTTTLKFFGRDTAGNSSTVQTVVYTIESGSGATHVTSGLVNKWDNLTNAITFADNGQYLNGSDDFSIVATIIPKAYANIFSQWSLGTSDSTLRWYVEDSGLAVIANLWGTDNGGSNTFPAVGTNKTTHPLTASTNNHVAIVKTNTKIDIYINNVKATTQNLNGLTLVASTRDIKVGDASTNVKTVAYYNRALTIEELTQNYNALK
jgi:chitodextrinase